MQRDQQRPAQNHTEHTTTARPRLAEISRDQPRLAETIQKVMHTHIATGAAGPAETIPSGTSRVEPTNSVHKHTASEAQRDPPNQFKTTVSGSKWPQGMLDSMCIRVFVSSVGKLGEEGGCREEKGGREIKRPPPCRVIAGSNCSQARSAQSKIQCGPWVLVSPQALHRMGQAKQAASMRTKTHWKRSHARQESLQRT